jgi:hypothetical protein
MELLTEAEAPRERLAVGDRDTVPLADRVELEV